MPHHFGQVAERLIAPVSKTSSRVAIQINATNDTAKTYDDSGRDGQDGLAPDLGTDPDLAAIVEAWPGLPGAMRAEILAMVKAEKSADFFLTYPGRTVRFGTLR